MASALPLSRNQCVVVNTSAPSSSRLMFGVPQGSVLRPVLFVLYTTTLSDIIANHSENHLLFADGTQLQKSTPPNDVQSLTHDLQSCTDDLTKLLACVSTQSQVLLPLIFLSYYTFTVLSALSAVHQTHACSNSNSSTSKPMSFHFLSLWPPHLEPSPPRHQALCYSLFLHKQTQDISLLRMFQLSNIVLHLY